MWQMCGKVGIVGETLRTDRISNRNALFYREMVKVESVGVTLEMSDKPYGGDIYAKVAS